MTTQELNTLNKLFDLTIKQNEIIKRLNNSYHDAVAILDKEHRQLAKDVREIHTFVHAFKKEYEELFNPEKTNHEPSRPYR